jgi:hypothetical protein
MYLSDSDEEEEIIVKFSDKKVTFDESKNKTIIFNAEEPLQTKYVPAFLKRLL